jgi:hypothetical protein
MPSQVPGGRRLSPLSRRNLQDGGGPAVPGEATWRHADEEGEGAIVRVEEDQIEREPHPEGVDAGAARDQQAGARLLGWEPGQTEQAAPEALRDGHLTAPGTSSG